MVKSRLIFATPAYQYLLDDVLQVDAAENASALERAPLTIDAFPDGERYLRLEERCEGRDVVVLGGTTSDAETLALYDIATAASMQGARSLSLIIPFFGYQTMERAVRPGEAVVAKSRANLLSSIPAAAFSNRVYLLDLHAEGIAHYFSATLRPHHVRAHSLVESMVREAAAGQPFVLGATDAGRAKWVEALANSLGCDAGFVFKRRNGAETEVTALAGDVANKRVVIYDDMIRTGGSLLGAVSAYRNAGASDVVAVTTHGVFPENAIEKLKAHGGLSAIYCSNSHPRAQALATNESFLKLRSIASTLRSALLPLV